MSKEAIRQEVMGELDKLNEAQQRQALRYIRRLATPPEGTPGEEFVRLLPTFSKEDIEAMKKAIEEECEQVNPDEW